MKTKILYFAGGLILGGLAGFFSGKKIAEKQAEERADEEIEKMRRYYERKSECKCSSDGCSLYREDDTRRNSERAKDSSGDVSNETVSGKNRTDYTRYYKPGSAKTDLVFEEGCDPEAEYEGPDEEKQELADALAQVEREDAERKMNKNRKPKIISAEAVGELPPYVIQEVVYYYPETDIMVDEDDRLIDDYGYLVGDCLEKYGFGDEDNDERIIFVRNFDLDTCYEVQKMPGNDPITEAALG